MSLTECLLSTPGELLDMAACYRIMQGLTEEKEDEPYIPDLR